MDNKEFWRVYHEQLEIVAGIAGKAACLCVCQLFLQHLHKFVVRTSIHFGNIRLAFIAFSILRVIEKELEEDDESDEGESGLPSEPGCDVIESGDVGVLFLDELKSTSDPNDRTDFPNFRSLLWRAMAQFPERVEPRSRELSPLLLRFIRLVWTVSLAPPLPGFLVPLQFLSFNAKLANT